MAYTALNKILTLEWPQDLLHGIPADCQATLIITLYNLKYFLVVFLNIKTSQVNLVSFFKGFPLLALSYLLQQCPAVWGAGSGGRTALCVAGSPC